MVSCGINTHNVAEDSKSWGGSMHYRRGVHASLSHLRGADLVVMVWHTLLSQ